MPAGLSWSRYLLFCSAAMLSMCAGTSVVHWYYEPLKDLKEYVERERQRRKEQSNGND